MKYAVLLSLLLTGLVEGMAQSRGFSVGPMASVDNYLHTDYSGSNYQTTHKTRYSLGFGVQYQTTSRIQFKTGLLYSDKGNTLVYKARPADVQLAISYPERVKIKGSFLDIPLLLGVRVAEIGRVALLPAVGVIGNIRLSEPERNPYEYDWCGTTNGRDPYVGQLQVTAAFELGLHYQATDKIIFGIAPYYRYSGHPNSIGTSLDVRYCFGN